ncbi:MAG: DNA replication protein [Candidatus Marinimicrobia bacterium]|nr:DNA replication protein [Candidatus Neomarinimicrobiota bacterium]|tara:strand:+ start:3123 stop:3782 length:660 start_codon:yes stop_codon:yes gene_type:complete
MSEQLIFNFPFKKSYLSQDFYVSENNVKAFKLIESWPNWSSRFVNIFGPKGSGKTHLLNILGKKIESVLFNASKVDSNVLLKYKVKESLIIDDYKNNIDEKLLYTITNMGSQDNKYLIISSLLPLKSFEIKLKDLRSRFTSFLEIGIDLPTDDLLSAILTKNFSDKQILITKKNIEYILKNIERSFEKINLFTNSIDNLSLVKSQPINLNLIKKVLKEI